MQHMFWRFRERDHPANLGDFQPEMWRAVEEHYRRCDSIVGKALQYVDDQTLLIVLSDHGMGSFRRGLNLNTWLYENGYLALKRGVRPGEETGDFFCNVDWDLTKAYALGLGGIFLNRKGREERGLVEEGEVESIKKAIAGGLTGLVDAEEDQVAVHGVVSREEVYSGPSVGSAPDLLVNFAPGYRVSWDTPLGGIPEGLFADNVSKWSGDHVIEPSFVPGVLFMNRPLRSENPGIIDLAPTILYALNLPAGPAMEGASLLS
jgi:predicted AlkP superfamily phosphohydrolase/phosphomutase